MKSMDVADAVAAIVSTLRSQPLVASVVTAVLGVLLLVHRKPKTRWLLPVSAMGRLLAVYVTWVATVEVALSAFPADMVDTASPWAALLYCGVALTLILSPRKELVIVDNPGFTQVD